MKTFTFELHVEAKMPITVKAKNENEAVEIAKKQFYAENKSVDIIYADVLSID